MELTEENWGQMRMKRPLLASTSHSFFCDEAPGRARSRHDRCICALPLLPLHSICLLQYGLRKFTLLGDDKYQLNSRINKLNWITVLQTLQYILLQLQRVPPLSRGDNVEQTFDLARCVLSYVLNGFNKLHCLSKAI